MSKSQATSKPATPAASRRGFILGAAAAGAATATVVGITQAPTADETSATETPPPPERGGGYRLSEHVKRYYKTTLV